ncbi:MAG: 3-deoxy-D-manno-octulosonic acid transferase [Rhodobacteraceae bacterium]|nr:3-deoxy-D-manno-octulosonic acid transferase [Paracoccaceae bacterium]
MNRNLSLAAYRALSRRKGQSATTSFALRPPGELIWAHVTSETRLSALCDLGARLKSQRPGLNLLLTTDPDLFTPPQRLPDGANWIYPLVSDHPDSVARFLAHWQPDAGLWTGGHLFPNLICTAAAQNIPMILLDAETNEFQSRQHRWFRELTRSSLMCFQSITTNGAAAAKLLQNYGIPAKNISISTRLSDGAAPKPCDEHALSLVTQSLAGQPVWLAAYVQASEIDAVIKAHRIAIRFSHRLLLVVILSDISDYARLESTLGTSGLRYCDWQPGYVIEDNIQVTIARAPDDLGLWFRAAPLTFMASSLTPGSAGRGPFEAVALGSAILYGPYVDDHLPAYSRLAAVGAARTVRDADGLGSAVVQLIAPDHSATMALAGWEVVTESAHLTDQLVDQVQDILDMREASHARP